MNSRKARMKKIKPQISLTWYNSVVIQPCHDSRHTLNFWIIFLRKIDILVLEWVSNYSYLLVIENYVFSEM